LITESSSAPLATALLVPLLVQMAALMLTSALSSGFDWLYPVRIGIVTAALYYYREIFTKLIWNWTWQAPLIGVLVFIVWMQLESNDKSSGIILMQGLEESPRGLAAAWLFFRVFGSIITVPLAEELAFRGYLIRKLVAKDFENVPNGTFTWLSFIVSSLLFGLLHDRWLAGTLAGLGYALALYRRGNIGDAIVAHMTTNALIAIVVLTQGRWALWA
ncbi:CAAX prenyl protease-related protein, partial [Methyloglobulus morosus]|uniref:CAAX prenyl protease-related protein n=1 Tax=Methyloglobulus morosus TaxID=1410681 RepID=UPI000569C19D